MTQRETNCMYEVAIENTPFTAGEVAEMQRTIGHQIPAPYSQTMCEDLHVMPRSAKDRGEGVMLMAMAKALYPSRA